ncbi:Cytosolic sulfotransferase 3 [Liparis tanakae]|uniref:Sulfotransferase n=1 Tax=Liparis tanakae TaxID=230148 RepID=A0A4Z2EPQ7_9TELE|nr:Cytosolic sulfotransferase 3 [Liparis tanakae]
MGHRELEPPTGNGELEPPMGHGAADGSRGTGVSSANGTRGAGVTGREDQGSPPRPELFDFHGVSMTHYFTDNWENIQNFQARPDDILIATYPKAGTTWVSYILDLLYFGETERQKDVPIYNRVPFLEIFVPSVFSGKDMVDNLATSPRLIKTHFPVQFIPKSFWEQNCRVSTEVDEIPSSTTHMTVVVAGSLPFLVDSD